MLWMSLPRHRQPHWCEVPCPVIDNHSVMMVGATSQTTTLVWRSVPCQDVKTTTLLWRSVPCHRQPHCCEGPCPYTDKHTVVKVRATSQTITLLWRSVPRRRQSHYCEGPCHVTDNHTVVKVRAPSQTTTLLWRSVPRHRQPHSCEGPCHVTDNHSVVKVRAPTRATTRLWGPSPLRGSHTLLPPCCPHFAPRSPLYGCTSRWPCSSSWSAHSRRPPDSSPYPVPVFSFQCAVGRGY